MADRATPASVEPLLERAAAGDASAASALYDLVHGELKRVAHGLMARELRGHTLQTTALVNEAFMRLAPNAAGRSADRKHFVRIAARAMRQVLVDHARRKTAKKRQVPRGGPPPDGAGFFERDPLDVIALDEAMGRLDAIDPELHRIVELRFFGGLTLEEVGALTGLSIRQVHRRWTFARGWLRRDMEGQASDG